MAPYADQDNIPPQKPVHSYLKPISRAALGCADDNPGAIDHGCITCLRGLSVPFFLRFLQEKGLSHQHEDSLARKGGDQGGQDRHGKKRFAGLSIYAADPDMWLGSERKRGGA